MKNKYQQYLELYRSGKITAGQARDFLHALETDPENEELDWELIKEWNSFSNREQWPAADAGRLLGRINNKLEKRPAPFSSGRRRYLHKVSKIAAAVTVLLVSMAVYWHFLNEKPSEVMTVVASKGVRKEIKLPDGSLVWLNAGSSMYYPNKFDKDKRSITLVGEAYFKVKSNPSSPFIVESGDLRIEVLGTGFNVNAYNRKNQMVSVLEGKVAVYESDERDEGLLLEARDQARYTPYSAEQLTKTKNYNTEKAIAWIDGRLLFEETDVLEALKTLERKYNVNFRLTNPALANCTITGEFEEESLPTILNILCTILKCQYEIIDKTVIISGPGCSP